MSAETIPAGTTVLVTGATGFTGANLTRRLVKEGLRVRALARETSNIEPLNDLPEDGVVAIKFRKIAQADIELAAAGFAIWIHDVTQARHGGVLRAGRDRL